MEENFHGLINQAPEFAVIYGGKILIALAVYFIGKALAGWAANMVGRAMSHRRIDAMVGSFSKNIVYYGLYTVVVVAALGQLGIQTASFVAIIAAGGLAIGFALQGSLANFAAGVLLILLRPFKSGDYVEAGGTAGVVKEISIVSTTLLTPDNRTIIVPNGTIMSDCITNYSTQAERRIDMVIGVSYKANLDQVRQELAAVVAADERVLKDKEVTIGVLELANSSVNLVVRPWVKTGDFWPVKFALTENFKKRFDEVGIEIPFPQMDVHLEGALKRSDD